MQHCPIGAALGIGPEVTDEQRHALCFSRLPPLAFSCLRGRTSTGPPLRLAGTSWIPRSSGSIYASCVYGPRRDPRGQFVTGVNRLRGVFAVHHLPACSTAQYSHSVTSQQVSLSDRRPRCFPGDWQPRAERGPLEGPQPARACSRPRTSPPAGCPPCCAGEGAASRCAQTTTTFYELPLGRPTEGPTEWPQSKTEEHKSREEALRAVLRSQRRVWRRHAPSWPPLLGARRARWRGHVSFSKSETIAVMPIAHFFYGLPVCPHRTDPLRRMIRNEDLRSSDGPREGLRPSGV